MNERLYLGEGFSVAFDPLDGSSIVDTNFTVGTIFGVWPGDKLIGVTGRDQVSCLHSCNMEKNRKPKWHHLWCVAWRQAGRGQVSCLHPCNIRKQ